MNVRSRTTTALTWLALIAAAGARPAYPAQTVGLFVDDSTLAGGGYTLFAPNRYTNTYLINHRGQLVHSWAGTVNPGQACYLLETGHLHRTGVVATSRFNSGGSGGRVQEFDWDGTLLWDWVYSTNTHHQHHDAIRLPNGNTLLIAWELETQAQAIAGGRNPAYVSGAGLWPDQLVEVHPTGSTTGDIVWEWHVWDHLVQDFDAAKPHFGVVADHPEFIDLNFTGTNATAADWTHVNGLDYDVANDQIILSVHGFNEVWVIDHGTTSAQAAGHTGGRYGHGGDVLYRWGNPRAYRRGTTSDQKFFGQHNAQWIRDGLPGAGHMMVFNNGVTRGYSTVDEWLPPVDLDGHYPLAPGAAYGPSALAWTYSATPPNALSAMNTSGAQRLANGNTLISDGPGGTFIEVTSSGQTVWRYVCPVTSAGPMTQGDPIPAGSMGQENAVFRCERYLAEFAGLAGRDLTPLGTIEHPAAVSAEDRSDDAMSQLEPLAPDPFTTVAHAAFTLATAQRARLELFDVRGRAVRRIAAGTFGPGRHEFAIGGGGLPAGLYFVRLVTREHVEVRKVARLP